VGRKEEQENIRKHGFDFADAWEVFDLPMLTSTDTREAYNENRVIGVGFLRQRIVVIVFAEQHDDTIRIISLRKALKHERERFGSYLRDELGAS
jgi:uncharacterized DUF497 family protein